MKQDSGTDTVEEILKNLEPKLGNNELKFDHHQIISNLRMQNNESFEKSNAQSKNVRHTQQFVKEDVGRHKFILRFPENLECASNHQDPARKTMKK